MKKIKHYTGDSYSFHKQVLASKREKDTQKEVKALDSFIQNKFAVYDDAFKRDVLSQMLPEKGLTNVQREALLKLYTFRSKPFQHLFNTLTTNEHNCEDKLCPNCTIDTASTFDHIVPQSLFPEYVDHPLNLLPCCAQCNSRKNKVWLDSVHSKRNFLNLYIDKIPDEQYLFVKLTICQDTLDVLFYLDNKYAIEAELYQRIQNHYTDLNLLQRYRENSYGKISILKSLIKSLKKNGEFSRQKIKKILLDALQLEMINKGNNHWEIVLQNECISNNQVFDFLCDTNT